MREVYEMLGNPMVREDRSLQVALRRFVFAGSKAQPEDRLIDLVICCEALLLKRHGIECGRARSVSQVRLPQTVETRDFTDRCTPACTVDFEATHLYSRVNTSDGGSRIGCANDDAPGGMPKQRRPGAYSRTVPRLVLPWYHDPRGRTMTITDDGDSIGATLSAARLGPYLARHAGDLEAAWRTYSWNIQACRAFYPLLHFAEIALRNAVHRELGSRFGRSDWWSTAPLTAHGNRLVEQAREKAGRTKLSPSTDDIVATLTLGFWVSLVSSAYDRMLWVCGLYRAFPHYRGRRDALHTDLRNVLELRNRVMHHEPIHRRDLAADHDTIYRLYGWLSIGLAARVRPFDQVPSLLDQV